MEKHLPLATLRDVMNTQEWMLNIVCSATQPVMEIQAPRAILMGAINMAVMVSIVSTVDQLVRDLQAPPAIQTSATFDK